MTSHYALPTPQCTKLTKLLTRNYHSYNNNVNWMYWDKYIYNFDILNINYVYLSVSFTKPRIFPKYTVAIDTETTFHNKRVSSVVTGLFSATSMCACYRNKVGIYFSAHVTQTQCSPVIIDAMRGVGAAYAVLPTLHKNIRSRLDWMTHYEMCAHIPISKIKIRSNFQLSFLYLISLAIIIKYSIIYYHEI